MQKIRPERREPCSQVCQAGSSRRTEILGVGGEQVRPYARRRLAVALAEREDVEHPGHGRGEPDQRLPLADPLDRAGGAAHLDRRALVAQPERVVQGRPERLRVAGVEAVTSSCVASLAGKCAR